MRGFAVGLGIIMVGFSMTFGQDQVVFDEFSIIPGYNKNATNNYLAYSIAQAASYWLTSTWHTWAEDAHATLRSGFDTTKSLNGYDSLNGGWYNITPAVQDGYFHAIFTAGNNPTGWSWASIGCTITGTCMGPGDSPGYDDWDFSKFTALRMVVKGSGNFTVGFQTRVISNLGGQGEHFVAWVQIPSTAQWTAVTIPRASFTTTRTDVTRDSAFKAVHKFFFEAKAAPNTKNVVDLAIDSIIFVGLKFQDFVDFYVPPVAAKISSLSAQEKGYHLVARPAADRSAAISFRTYRGKPLSLTLHDVKGRQAAVLFSGRGNGSVMNIQWNGADQSRKTVSGCYILQLRAGKTTVASCVLPSVK